MAEEKKPFDELTFREALAELDEIVKVLESNTLELEESMDAYERGVGLLNLLTHRLDEADQKIEVLMGRFEMVVDDELTDTTLS